MLRLTPEEENEIYAMYRSGHYYIKEIAEWIGCSQTAVYRVIKTKDAERKEKIHGTSITAV